MKQHETDESLRHEIEQLRQEIRRHDRLYYLEAAPEISDLQYDRLMQRLERLEARAPQLVTPDSPTQRVGDQPVPELQQVAHHVPMLSIDNTYSLNELQKYAQRMEALLKDEKIQWVVELKIDGVAVSLIYENGLLVTALTRGNGRVGDDITHNLRTLSDVPLRLVGDPVPELLEVRGEVFMRNSDLVQLNERRERQGEPAYANTRNVAAGSVRLLDPRICANRPLHLYCHGLGATAGCKASTYIEFLEEIRGYGLPATPHVRAFDSMDQAIDYSDEVIERLHELDFEVDGLVLKVNDFAQRQRLGATAKSPRWLVAYKWEKYEGVTRLQDIHVQVGKSGAITPVAELEPIELAGTTVSRASLHNADEIQRKDVRIGDRVVVEKAGKIIPHIVRVEKHERKGHVELYAFPTECPECQAKLVKDEGGVYIRCPNRYCPAQVKERIRYFAGRNAMDIDGLGDKLIDQLVTRRLVADCADLYTLTADQLQELDRMGRRSSEKLVEAIRQSRQRGLARVLNALSIRHVGQRVAQVLAAQFQAIERLQQATVKEIADVHEIGDVIAQSVVDFLQSEFGSETINRLMKVGVKLDAIENGRSTTQALTGKTLVVTGKLEKYTRDQIHEMIAAHGGKPSSSISKNTDFLVAGENAGSKLEKANQLGVDVISEDDFQRLIDV